MDGWQIIVPPRERLTDTARELLTLADNPADVRTQRGGREFLVRDYVADRLNKPRQRARARRKKENGS